MVLSYSCVFGTKEFLLSFNLSCIFNFILLIYNFYVGCIEWSWEKALVYPASRTQSPEIYFLITEILKKEAIKM